MKTTIKFISAATVLFTFLSFIIAGDEKFKTVKTDNQEWMAENLNVEHYRNGDVIPQVQDSAKWVNLKTGAWCTYKFKSGEQVVKGKLYNGYALTDPRGIAPTGWAVPKREDWNKLDKWRRADTTHLKLFLGADMATRNCEENKSYYRWAGGTFGSMKCLGLWWLPDNDDMTYNLSRCEGYDGYYFGMAGLPKNWKNYGFYIRCVKTNK